MLDALHQGFEFPTLFIYITSALSKLVDMSSSTVQTTFVLTKASVWNKMGAIQIFCCHPLAHKICFKPPLRALKWGIKVINSYN